MRLSIIMPIKNGEAYLQRALDSLLTQDFKDFEVIMQDNMSTDKTYEIAKSYERKLPLKIYREEALGPCDAVMKGIEKSKGEIIGELMYDDEFTQFAFGLVDKKFRENNIEWLFSPVDLINQDGSLLFTMGQNPDITLKDMVGGNNIPGISVFFSRKLYDEVKGYDQSFLNAEDYELWCRFLSKGYKPYFVPQKLAIYYVTGVNNGMKQEAVDSAEKVKNKYRPLCL